MKKSITILVIALIILILLHIPFSSLLAQESIMPTSEIKKGMMGVGKTVVTGVNIEEFAVKVLGVLRENNQELILVEVSGPLIDLTGGIAAGMSGSPVYIDGKLIGAIGYGWSLTDHRVGLVTPIESMLKLLQLNKESVNPRKSFKIGFDHFQSVSSTSFEVEERIVFSEPLNFSEGVFDQIYFCESYKHALELEVAGSSLIAYPVQTPLMISGLKGRALKRLMEDLHSFDLIPIQTGGNSTSNEAKPELQPGSAIAVQLVRGDIDVSAIGTMTYLQDDQILAFGHPFLNQGHVEYFLSGAEVLTVVDNLEMPFKLGVATDLAGVISQDRSVGISGKLGISPKIIPINVLVEDFDLQSKQEYQFQVIRNEELVVPLVISAVLQTIDTTIDRQGFGTSKLSLQIVGDKLPDQLFKYENMYYSGADIAADSLYDLYNILTYIFTNPFEKVNLGSINISVQLEQIRQVAIVEEVKLLNDELYPGDKAKIEVTYRPYRGKLFKNTYEVQIPEDIQTGPASLTISGGIYGSYMLPEDSQSAERVEEINYAEGKHYKSLKEVLEQYTKGPKNNELVIEIMPYYVEVMTEEEVSEKESNLPEKDNDSTADLDTKNSTMEEVKEKDKTDSSASHVLNSIKEYFRTNYVLEGSLTMEITILDKEKNTEEPIGENQTGSKVSEVGKHI